MTEKLLELATQLFVLNFLEYVRLHQKPSHKWFIILHCITGQNFERIWPCLGELWPKNTQNQPKIILSAAMKTFNIWKLGNYRSDIKWNFYRWYKPRYVLPQHLSFTKKWGCQSGGGRRESILKLLVKSDSNLRSFGDLLHINLQNLWPRWLLTCLLIITSPSTSPSSFSLSFVGHWHSFTHNRFTKWLLPSQKPSKTGSVNSVFGNIGIKKNFQKLHVNNKRTSI